MTAHLLDVNVLLALSDPMHIHHDAAHRWFGSRVQTTWATCPITENGFVRIASHPSYPNRPGDVSTVVALLQALCSVTGHTFWADTVRLHEVLPPGAVLTHAHITDVYLLGLAAYHQGTLVTFDQKLALRAGTTDALVVITP